ncbi:MAG: sigma-70 family RNA polymerase sigma factor [Chloroflexota bacterium]|jgi:RNA polymerase sigma-70 factor (ECF subfamily)
MVSANAAVPRANDDTPLVLRAIRRDQEAFGELYDRHVVRVYRHIYYMVGNAADAEDLSAQTFLRAWEAIERYQVRGAPFVSWLLRIAHNLGVSHLRSKRDSSELHDGIVDTKERRDPEWSYQQTAEEELVREAILRLREEQRQVIILRFIEDLDYTEVAEIIGKSVAAIRVIQHRALNSLRKQMKLLDPAV